jgi:multicomponent Na+:H+ antiporter subunit B
MGYSLILRTTARFLLPLLLLLAIFLLLRGHDEPGGGFIAGLVASLAFALYVFAFDTATTRRVLRHDPRSLVGIGLLIACLSALPAAVLGQPFFTAQWWSIELGPFGVLKLSTPLFFDIGVFLVVIGTVMTIVLALAEVER